MANEEDAKEAARLERKTPQVERLLKQFIGDGERANTAEYKKTWVRCFGRRTGEHAGTLAEGWDWGGDPFEKCDDTYCWCRQP